MPLSRVTTIPQGGTNAGRLHVYLSVFDQNDANVGFSHAVQDLQLTNAQLQSMRSENEARFRYTIKVDLKPGLYRVVVVVRDELNEELGKASTTIDTRS
jgi:hypothetical protein